MQVKSRKLEMDSWEWKSKILRGFKGGSGEGNRTLLILNKEIMLEIKQVEVNQG